MLAETMNTLPQRDLPHMLPDLGTFFGIRKRVSDADGAYYNTIKTMMEETPPFTG